MELQVGICHLLMAALCVLSFATADLFTSINDLQRLVEADQEIPDLINRYIEEEESRLEELKSVVDRYRINNDNIQQNLQAVSNPVNAFHMIKRLTNEWKELQAKMRQNSAEEFISDVSAGQMPSDEDLSGAATGLLRLQDTYRLDTKELTDGVIQGKRISNELSAHDCYIIGRVAYNAEDYYHTLLWMQEGLDRAKESQNSSLESEILEYMAFALYKQGNVKRALLTTDRLYEIYPQHPRAKGNIKWYEDQLTSEGVKRSDFRRNIPGLVNRRPADILENKEREIYEALCRNEVPRSVKEMSQLYCYYKMDRPYLRLAPFKVEILRFNPLAVLFHSVISDNEVAVIQELAGPKLARATVQNSVTGQLETASYRISKSAWLKGEEDEVVDRINRRMEQMTNLNMETAEELQIANYGIGGHYDPHFDFARKDEPKAFSDLGTGNRIATVLFYMTEPDMFGGTAFTELRMTVQPSKNNALFWYNLYRNGEGDLRTRHGMAMLTGHTEQSSKLYLSGLPRSARNQMGFASRLQNKWIHEKDQEFRRPCALKFSTQERYVGDLGGPEPRYHWNTSPY